NSRADRMPLFAKQIPEDHWRFTEPVIFKLHLFGALDEKILLLAARSDSGQVALHIRTEHRHPRICEAFRQHLQRHSLACTRRPGDQPVPVRSEEHTSELQSREK